MAGATNASVGRPAVSPRRPPSPGARSRETMGAEGLPMRITFVCFGLGSATLAALIVNCGGTSAGIAGSVDSGIDATVSPGGDSGPGEDAQGTEDAGPSDGASGDAGIPCAPPTD